MIGIMSDSHDNLDAVRKAVRLFNQTQCRLVIHAGDIVAPFSAGIFKDLSCPVKAVFGNCDGEKAGLIAAFHSLGAIKEEPHLFNFKKKLFAVKHLDKGISELIRKQNPDVLVYGHTHKPEIRQWDSTLIINPGETGGWVTGRKTVVLLDEKSLSADIISL